MELSDYPKYLLSIEKIASKIYGGLSFSGRIFIERQDLVQAGKIALWQCIQKSKKGELKHFDGYFYLRVKGAMIDTIRKFGSLPTHHIRDKRDAITFIKMAEDFEETTHINTDRMDIDKFLSNLKGRDKRIMDKYMRGFTAVEIAEDETVSASRLSQVMKRIIKDIQVEYAI